MARRKKVFGLPIGRKKKSIAPKAIAAGASLAAIPAVAVARRLKAPISEGREKVEQVTDVASKISHIGQAMEGHSSTIGKVGAAIGEVKKLTSGGGEGAPKLSHLIEEHTDVAVPRAVAYNQWTQFEMFPSIAKAAEQVEQKERDKLQWTAKIGPSRRTWQGEITEQVPDERIAWRSSGGLQLKGVVTFHSLDDDLTRVLVQIQYDPKGFVEGVGNLLRIQRRRVRRELRLFKHFIELRGEETGAWRGRVAKKDDSGFGSGTQQRPKKKKAASTAASARKKATARAGTTSRARKAS